MEIHLPAVEEFRSHAKAVLNDPPRLSEHVWKLRPLIKTIANVNIYLHHLLSNDELLDNAPAIELIRIMQQLRDELFFVTLCDHYHSFLNLVSMEYEHPTTGAMLIYLTVAFVELVLDSLYHKTLGAIPFLTNFSMPHPASAAPPVARAFLCISTTPVSKYATRELVQALKVLAIRWHELTPSPDLLSYILALIHRGFILMTKPGTGKVHDVPFLRKLVSGPPECNAGCPAPSAAAASLQEEQPTLYGGSWDLLRRLSGGLTRMYAVAKFATQGIDSREDGAAFLMASGSGGGTTTTISAALVAEAIKLAVLDRLRGEMLDLFRTSGMWFGDLDIFIEKSNMKPAKPRNVIFNAKQSEIQYTWNHLAQSLSLVDLCKLDEDLPFFQSCYTFAHQFYAQNIKLYCAGVILRESITNFMGDYCVAEQEFISNRHTITARTMALPLIVQQFGKMTVLYKRRLVVCKSTEQALLVWAKIIEKHENNLIDGMHVGKVLKRLLNEAPQHAASDAWRDNNIVEGEIDM